ncbi:hypothetical protein HJC23_003033 [Cyclotella cryptica]|uniref:Uncharacterized protein n=1 Tax=Cyclotella cryptica TaxID=29204 RepID=A0ABD3PYH5_9STRA|eukprot:CCRYP_010208-RA/>CCRYP_010208-RA protein AED:0.12 eAED:0.12 QI:105/1/1/1/1/1/4/148/289
MYSIASVILFRLTQGSTVREVLPRFLSYFMNLLNIAHILAAVNSGIGDDDTPCQVEVFEATACILGIPAPAAAMTLDEINQAFDCLTCPAVDSPNSDGISCGDLATSTYCSNVDGCIESKCNAECSVQTSKFFQCINNFLSAKCGSEVCPGSNNVFMTSQVITGLLEIEQAEQDSENAPCYAETVAVNKCALGQAAGATEKDSKSLLTSVAKCASCPVPSQPHQFCASVTDPGHCSGVSECKKLNCKICDAEFSAYFACLDEIILRGCEGYTPCVAGEEVARNSLREVR